MDKTIAKTILEQLGGNRFIAMTGSKNFIALENGLLFQVGSGAKCGDKTVNRVRIILTPMDTYVVEVIYVRGVDFKVVEVVADVYCDNLQRVFTRLTGFHTRL